MTLDIRATPFFQDGELNQLVIHLNNKETIDSFVKEILQRALNCGEDVSGDWKALADKLEHGRILQNYLARHKDSGTKAVYIESQKVILSDPLPICPSCGQKGYGHLFNCALNQK